MHCVGMPEREEKVVDLTSIGAVPGVTLRCREHFLHIWIAKAAKRGKCAAA